MDFKDFNFNPELLEGLLAMGFRNATPIQQEAIPLILAKKDLIACAQTGTGKTGAYLLPVMNMISQTENRHNNTLILAPTRELAQQIDLQVEALSYFTNISSITVYGGGDGIAYEQQKRSMRDGVDIIIATPGRLISHLSSGVLKLDQLQHLILDEADRMLDMGFYDDIMRIVSFLPEKRQTVLFSATMPPKIRKLAGSLLHEPEQVSIAISKPAAGISQQAYLVHDLQKVKLLTRLMKNVDYPSILIFASTKEKVKNLGKVFRGLGFKAEAFHSDLDQKEREAILSEFKNKRVPVLIGTDVLSRGIDVEGITLVINFDVPHDPEDYIHRIGRTARAATTGTAITLVNEKDKRKFANIEKLIGKTIERMPLPEELGEVPAESENKSTSDRSGRDKRKPQRKVWNKKPKTAGTAANQSGPASDNNTKGTVSGESSASQA
ncbi:DEAD/DEAH box helicase [Pedobacter antarcticus]|uniref:RNA helicase n=2 Tax=Pedobacter antarcticus TaxID=34086 RepID=A0A081PF28_9SPHI|nr:DEAD/DEAH box helicase [Pedobacter antarcticus]KEQ29301.1 RNA helicase [Pedobacter antarcticus 4BY]SDL95071.1 Superfamily II DNA and RNA helicase [Pedobacter antarcticus]SFE76497.1 Superfamily II DNA and RNA helicase [Pedobacter antarcticus]